VSRYQKCKTNLDFTEATDSEWHWHHPGHMQLCTSLQTDNHASTPPPSFFTGRMHFLPPKQQRQSTEGKFCYATRIITERGKRQTVVVGGDCIVAGTEVGEFCAMKAGRLSESLLILQMQFAHQQQLRVQLVQLQAIHC